MTPIPIFEVPCKVIKGQSSQIPSVIIIGVGLFTRLYERGRGTDLEMIDLSSDEERERRGEPLFEQHADFTLTIHLTPESGHPELVLGA